MDRVWVLMSRRILRALILARFVEVTMSGVVLSNLALTSASSRFRLVHSSLRMQNLREQAWMPRITFSVSELRVASAEAQRVFFLPYLLDQSELVLLG